jgi:hypothetical protein
MKDKRLDVFCLIFEESDEKSVRGENFGKKEKVDAQND